MGLAWKDYCNVDASMGVSNAGGTITQPVQMVATGGANLLNLPNGSYSTTLTYAISAD